MKIMFIGATPQARVYKQVKSLKRIAEVDISLVCFRYDEILFDGLFENVYILENGNPYQQILQILNKNDTSLVHLFSDKYAIAKPIIDFKIPYVFDPYDYFLPQDGLSSADLKRHWQIMTHNARAIILRYDETIQSTQEFKSLALDSNKKTLQLFDYACDDFFIEKKSLLQRNDRIVHVGYLSSLKLAKKTHGASQFENVAKNISKYRGYDIFCSLWSDDFDLLQNEYVDIKKEFGENFNLYSALDQMTLNRVISNYKYGSYIHDSEVLSHKTPYIKKSVGNKIFNYMEAGLPIITTNEIEASYKFVEKHNIGRNIKSMNNFGTMIDEIDHNYDDLLDETYMARETTLNIINHIDKLYRLYSEIS